MNSSPKWQGYLVVGITDREKMQADIDACFEAGELAGLVVEPARVFSAAGSIRKPLEVWNKNRTKLIADSECSQPDLGNTDEYVKNFAQEVDHVRIAGGYQSEIRHNGDQNIAVAAILAGGELGPATSEIPLYENELIVSGSSFLDGGRECNTVLRTINGVPGPNLFLTSDRGVLIGNHPELHRIVVAVNGEGLNFCPDVSPAEQVECLPHSGTNCGPAPGVVIGCPGLPDAKADFLSEDQIVVPGEPPAPRIYPGSTDKIMLYGTCRYEREAAGWVLLVNGAQPNAICNPPTSTGYVGQQRSTLASPAPIELPGYVRNPLFNNGDEFWSLPEGGSIVSADDSEMFGNLPYAEFTGTLSQSLVSLPTGRYRLQFLLEATQAVTYRVFSVRDQIVLIEGVIPAQLEFNFASDFFDTGSDDVLIDFTTAGTAQLTDVGLATWD